MSKKYDRYLSGHIDAVNKAARWMLDNLDAANELSGDEVMEIIGNCEEHDDSKWMREEYPQYDAYFYGEKDEDAFNAAWLHHIHNNGHHWQHWVLVNGYGKFGDPGVVSAIEMPRAYVFEMIADWWSFSWRGDDMYEIFDWYADHRDKIVLHPNTREYVERILGEIKSGLDNGVDNGD